MPPELINEKLRQVELQPEAIENWGWKYHHMGIPTQQILPNEKHIPHLGMHVSGFDKSPYGIEWMRFDKDSPIDKLIQNVPHIAFEVDDLDYELRIRDFQILTPPNPPAEGIRVAMILHNGAPVELIEFKKKKPGEDI